MLLWNAPLYLFSPSRGKGQEDKVTGICVSQGHGCIKQTSYLVYGAILIAFDTVDEGFEELKRKHEVTFPPGRRT